MQARDVFTRGECLMRTVERQNAMHQSVQARRRVTAHRTTAARVRVFETACGRFLPAVPRGSASRFISTAVGLLRASSPGFVGSLQRQK
jgi:hypothetical protein